MGRGQAQLIVVCPDNREEQKPFIRGRQEYNNFLIQVVELVILANFYK